MIHATTDRTAATAPTAVGVRVASIVTYLRQRASEYAEASRRATDHEFGCAYESMAEAFDEAADAIVSGLDITPPEPQPR